MSRAGPIGIFVAGLLYGTGVLWWVASSPHVERIAVTLLIGVLVAGMLCGYAYSRGSSDE
jgi:uncharacterized membrane protein